MPNQKVCFVFFRNCANAGTVRPSRIPSLIAEYVGPYLASDRFVAFGVPIAQLKTPVLRLAVGFAYRHIVNSGVRQCRVARKKLVVGTGISEEILHNVRQLIAADGILPFGVSIRLMPRQELLVTLAYILLHPNTRDSPLEPDYYLSGATLH